MAFDVSEARDARGRWVAGMAPPTDLYSHLAAAEDRGGAAEVRNAVDTLMRAHPELGSRINSGLADLGYSDRVDVSDAEVPEKSDMRSEHVAARHAEVPAEQVAAAREIAAQARESDSEHLGLRVLPDDSPDVVVGTKLRASRHWVDGRMTSRTVGGTSTIGLRGHSVNDALDALHDLGALGKRGHNGYYLGKRIALVSGEDSKAGEDKGELIVKKARVLAVWHKADSGGSAIQKGAN